MGITIAILILIFVSSTRVEYYTVATLMKLTGNKDLSLRLYTIFFLPGTIVHEFCHLIMAQLLGVRSTGMELFPRFESDHVVMGEVGIERTSILRRVFIGAAPFLLGFPLTLMLIYILGNANITWWQAGLLLYAIFQVTNASFSSSKDMEGSFAVFAIGILVLFALQMVGLPITQWIEQIINIAVNDTKLETINRLLCLPLGINLCAWIFGKWILG